MDKLIVAMARGIYNADCAAEVLGDESIILAQAALSAVREARFVVVHFPPGDPSDITAGIPDSVIEAGQRAWDKAQEDMDNYISGVTPDQLARIRRRAFREKRPVLLKLAGELPQSAWGVWRDAPA